MIYIITALFAEALPLIKHFSLKKISHYARFPVYAGEKFFLIVSGVQKINSAVSIAYCLGNQKPTGSQIVNIGIAGCSINRFPIGTLFLIHKVIDLSTSKEFFPDILLDHGLPEADLTTSDIPIFRTSAIENPFFQSPTTLVDMEASGFMQSARLYFSSHQISILKLVSDYLQEKQFDAKFVEDLMGDNLSHIELYLNELIHCSKNQPFMELSGMEKQEIDRIEHICNLSYGDAKKLKDTCTYLKYRKPEKLYTTLANFQCEPLKQKEKNQQQLKQLIDLLNSDIN
jgi:adenosylhomocysteine nucleosidase